MSRTVCKFTAIVTALALLLCGLTGCKRESAGLIDEAKFEKLKSEGIIVLNPIDIISVNVPSDGESAVGYMRIEGLKNEDVQKKINDRIRSVFDSMVNCSFLPPYRGIGVMMKHPGIESNPTYINVWSEYNSGNILSVVAVCYVDCKADDGFEFTYSYTVPMVFDLSTGDELKLADIFRDGTDGLETVNGYIDTYLLKNGYGTDEIMQPDDDTYPSFDTINMTAPFKGVKEGQKFYIDQFGRLTLVFDYDTPEFYTGMSGLPVWVIDSSVSSGIKLFRETDGSIYSSDDVRCILDYEYSSELEYRQVGNPDDSQMSIMGSFYYRNDDPDEAVRQVEEIVSGKSHFPFDINAKGKELDRKFGAGKYRWNFYIYALEDSSPAKGYYCWNINWLCSATPKGDDIDMEGWFYNCNRWFCFDAEGRLLDPSELFNDPEHYRELLEKAISASTAEGCKHLNLDFEPDDEYRALVSKMVSKINGAGFRTDYLTLSYDISDSEFEQFYHSLKDKYGSDACNVIYESFLSPGYQYIGARNLRVFNEVFA